MAEQQVCSVYLLCPKANMWWRNTPKDPAAISQQSGMGMPVHVPALPQCLHAVSWAGLFTRLLRQHGRVIACAHFFTPRTYPSAVRCYGGQACAWTFTSQCYQIVKGTTVLVPVMSQRLHEVVQAPACTRTVMC